MTSLLSGTQKSSIHAVLDRIHDTFVREITIYKSNEEILIDTGNGTENPFYNVPKSEQDQIETIQTSARILYETDQKRVGMADGIGNDDGSNLSFPTGRVRLKLSKEAYDLIVKAKKIKIDGVLHELISSPARPGPFTPNYWTVFLKRVD
jgi:hypothetical protein